MAVYEYRGILADSGKPTKGYRDADSPKALRAMLRRDGILLTDATEESERKQRAKRDIDLLAVFRRPKIADVAVLTRQLATLVRAGVPLVDSLAALTEQVEKEVLVRVLTAVRESVNEGTSFSKSLAAHPKVFPPLFVNMVAAGEASGTLEAVLERLADFMEGQARLRGKVGAALAYPVLMADDILIVGSDLVPVGNDQKQHLEVTRDIATAFHAAFGAEVFNLPQPLIRANVAVIPGVDGRKMSKSYDNTIELFASEKEIRKRLDHWRRQVAEEEQ